MKEDILEQLVDGYFLRKASTFTKHNVKYRPNSSDINQLDGSVRSRYTVSSDIDVLSVHLKNEGSAFASAISCKSWQSGFDVDFWYRHLSDPNKHATIISGGEVWKKFRELTEPVWAKAFRDKVYEETGSRDFDYYIAVTKFKKNKTRMIEQFIQCPLFLNNLTDQGKYKVTINFLTLDDMLREIFLEKSSTTLESTEIGRFMQLIRAAGVGMVFD